MIHFQHNLTNLSCSGALLSVKFSLVFTSFRFSFNLLLELATELGILIFKDLDLFVLKLLFIFNLKKEKCLIR